MSVSVRRSTSGRVVVVEMHGDHDIASSHELRRAFEGVRGAQLVVADMTDCTFLDSTAMGVLVGAFKHTRETGGRLIGLNPSGIVAKALQITGLDDLLQTSTDVAGHAAGDLVSSDVGIDQELEELLREGEDPASLS